MSTQALYLFSCSCVTRQFNLFNNTVLTVGSSGIRPVAQCSERIQLDGQTSYFYGPSGSCTLSAVVCNVDLMSMDERH